MCEKRLINGEKRPIHRDANCHAASPSMPISLRKRTASTKSCSAASRSPRSMRSRRRAITYSTPCAREGRRLYVKRDLYKRDPEHTQTLPRDHILHSPHKYNRKYMCGKRPIDVKKKKRPAPLRCEINQARCF